MNVQEKKSFESVEENPPLRNREEEQESSAIFHPFPGVLFCFAKTPGGIGKEPDREDEDTVVLHYCHMGQVLLGQEKRLVSGEIWIVPKPEQIGAAMLLSKGYSGVSMILKPNSEQEMLGRLCAEFFDMDLDLHTLAGSLRQDAGKIIPGTDKISRVFSQLFVDEPPYGERYFRLKALELLMHLAAWEPKPSEQTQPYIQRETLERVETIRQFLTEHLDCRLTQAQIAKQFHISLNALKHTFHSRYGLTLDAYLREQRIAAAKQLLLETNLSVSEIAHRVGYESHSQFTAVFRSCEAQPPAEYRKLRRDLK